MGKIKLLITDFDGTLVDTFEANFLGYQAAFNAIGMSIDKATYQKHFGMRFDRFMDCMNIGDIETRQRIQDLKTQFYPDFFNKIKVNTPLLEIIRAHHRSGGMTAIASTARTENLMNLLTHINAVNDFDIILAGDEVKEGKPSPEIYLTVLKKAGVTPGEAIIFEDSPVGVQAAQAAGIQHLVITPQYFKNLAE